MVEPVRACGSLSFAEQRLVTLEELGVLLQVAGDRLFLGFRRWSPVPGRRLVSSSLRCSPSNLDAAFEGHFRRSGEPDRLAGPAQFTRNSPPRTRTLTLSSSRP